MGLVRRLPTCVKLVSVRVPGSLISHKRTFADEAKQKKIAVITGASRYIWLGEREKSDIVFLKILCRGIGYTSTKELYRRLGGGSSVYGTTRGSPDQLTSLVRSVQ